MSILISCLGCGIKLKAPDNTAGKMLKCPKCKMQILVPSFSDDQNLYTEKIATTESKEEHQHSEDVPDESQDESVPLEKSGISMQQHRGNRIKSYFSPIGKPNMIGAAILIGLGFILNLSLLDKFDFGIITFGLAMILFGIALIPTFIKNLNNWIAQQPTDSEIDFYISDALTELKKLSLQKSNLDSSELVGEQLLVTGFQFFNSANAEVLYKKGLDDILRFTPIKATVLNLTTNQIVCFQCVFDLTSQNPLNISTDEYFYKDVVSIATKTSSETYDSKLFNGKIQLDNSEKFVLTTSGGTTLEVFLTDPKLIEKMGGGKIPTTEAEKTISVVRKMLREKKSNT